MEEAQKKKKSRRFLRIDGFNVTRRHAHFTTQEEEEAAQVNDQEKRTKKNKNQVGTKKKAEPRKQRDFLGTGHNARVGGGGFIF